jgi:hypothetical protein
VIYSPPLQRLFGFTALAPADFLKILALTVAALGIIFLAEKVVRFDFGRTS